MSQPSPWHHRTNLKTHNANPSHGPQRLVSLHLSPCTAILVGPGRRLALHNVRKSSGQLVSAICPNRILASLGIRTLAGATTAWMIRGSLLSTQPRAAGPSALTGFCAAIVQDHTTGQAPPLASCAHHANHMGGSEPLASCGLPAPRRFPALCISV